MPELRRRPLRAVDTEDKALLCSVDGCSSKAMFRIYPQPEWPKRQACVRDLALVITIAYEQSEALVSVRALSTRERRGNHQE